MLSCLVPEAGAPSCGIENEPGSSPSTQEVRYHVGNPINVVSGNKYQFDLDYKSFTSGLTLARHYNSTLNSHDVGFGPGWRHTYQVLLTRSGEDHLSIVQSDGRLIHFYRSTDVSRPDLFLPTSAGDGYLESGERSTWYLSDGRRMIFQGSYLVLLDSGGYLGSVSLNYRAGKLQSVTDSHGDVLLFQYVPGIDKLPEYGSATMAQVAGSIASVRLPNGELIQYQYGSFGNLLEAQYPDGQVVEYGYDDDDWPNHLSGRQSSVEGRISEWRYDSSGQAIAWIEEGGRNGLEIVRDSVSGDSSVAEPGTSGAVVTYVDGRKTRYDWSGENGGFSDRNGTFNITCDNCVPETAPSSGPVKGPQSTDPMGDAVASLWAGLKRLNDASTGQPSGESTYDGVYPHEQGDIAVKLTTDRTGHIKQMVLGELTFSELARRSLTESLPPCFAGENLPNPETFSHDRVQALGRGAEPCQLDGLVSVELLQKLETYSSPEPDTGFNPGGGLARSASDVPWWSEMRRYCGLPAGKTCQDLTDDLNMALLSRCAYGNDSCEPLYTLVKPEEIGFTNDQFHLDGFDAQLYQDPATGRYIVAFRGTDGVGDDWDVNFEQARGNRARQYDLAFTLARDIARRFPGAEIEFTGHSLGGGLATVAALATQRPATVFNTAAFQPTTAALYGLTNEYANADQHVEHIHTDFDPVTVLQERLDDLDWGNLQTAPGHFTQIPNPDVPWVNAVHENAQQGIDGFFPAIWHSMDAVIHVLESLIAVNCP
ncbi:hypothetical protein IMCC3135_07000 [Granulosicoccus antarcticus IMCC3135]|uniref:DUF6531 domain-containing protein n=1 Tax=Granulosicoccus antarcticus IMCC3135 TaxID=1192854 RepID=A0A2Z2NJM4_9GAMM|nr:hypothetical protein IMCC3135_07000 [Granulosicoccus antarcticus IMCC3135]